MRNSTIKIESEIATLENIKFPPYLLDMTEGIRNFMELKETLTRVFLEYYNGEDCKGYDNTEDVKMLHLSLNELFDALHIGNIQHRRDEGFLKTGDELGMSIEEVQSKVNFKLDIQSKKTNTPVEKKEVF